MVAGQQPAIARNRVLHAVAEDQCTAALDLAGALQVSDDTVEADFSKANDDAHAGKGGDFLVEPRRTGGNLLREGLVAGRSAAHHGGDPGAGEAHTILTMGGGGLRGKTCAVETRIEKIAGTIAGEGAPGAIGAVRAGSEADEEYARLRIAEGGDRLAPVFKFAVRAAFFFGDRDAVRAEARAAIAFNDPPVQQRQGRSRAGGRVHALILVAAAAQRRSVEWVRFRIQYCR